MSFEFTWQAEDGYCGGSRPQHIEISEGDIEDDMSEDRLVALLEELVQEDFSQKVNPSWRPREQEKFLEWAREVQATRKPDEQ